MKKLRITIENKSYEVTVEDLTDALPYQAPMAPAASASTASAQAASAQAASAQAASAQATPQPAMGPAVPKPQLPLDAGAVTSPMAGSIKSLLVKAGDPVKPGQPLVVLEAMKMDNQITAPVTGAVKRVNVAVGESVQEGHVLVVLE